LGESVLEGDVTEHIGTRKDGCRIIDEPSEPDTFGQGKPSGKGFEGWAEFAVPDDRKRNVRQYQGKPRGRLQEEPQSVNLALPTHQANGTDPEAFWTGSRTFPRIDDEVADPR